MSGEWEVPLVEARLGWIIGLDLDSIDRRRFR